MTKWGKCIEPEGWKRNSIGGEEKKTHILFIPKSRHSKRLQHISPTEQLELRRSTAFIQIEEVCVMHLVCCKSIQHKCMRRESGAAIWPRSGNFMTTWWHIIIQLPLLCGGVWWRICITRRLECLSVVLQHLECVEPAWLFTLPGVQPAMTGQNSV